MYVKTSTTALLGPPLMSQRAYKESGSTSASPPVQVRKYVNALGAAFSRRSDEAQASTLAHQLSLGVFALEDALAHGRPYAAAASQLASSAPQDELVASACQALPQDAADRVCYLVCTGVLCALSLASVQGSTHSSTFEDIPHRGTSMVLFRSNEQESRI